MFKMSTIIGHASNIVNIIKIDVVELVFMSFNKATNLILSDRLLDKFLN